MNARPAMADLRARLAARHGVAPDLVALGAGSGELLDSGVRAFTSSARALVAGLPTYEAPARVARRIGSAVVEVRVDDDGRLDLERMIEVAAGAGLVFVCNPNNPTGTVHPAAAIADVAARIHKASPDTIILIDEAYHDYVTDPAYATAIPLAARGRNVLVSRTFSKAFGMAGLRLGYVVGDAAAVARLARWNMPFNASVPAVAAALAVIDDDAQLAAERRRNTDARAFATRFFRDSGLRVIESQTNFVWVDLGRPAQEFRDACEKRGVLVGRAFPPFERTHCRISIGTMEEMRRAREVFRALV
jgi:histidinol-phosphate aminotransferase